MVNGTEPELLFPVATATCAVPAVVIKVDGTLAVNCAALRKLVGTVIFRPSGVVHVTFEAPVKFWPVTERVKASVPATPVAGLTEFRVWAIRQLSADNPSTTARRAFPAFSTMDRSPTPEPLRGTQAFPRKARGQSVFWMLDLRVSSRIATSANGFRTVTTSCHYDSLEIVTNSSRLQLFPKPGNRHAGTQVHARVGVIHTEW